MFKQIGISVIATMLSFGVIAAERLAPPINVPNVEKTDSKETCMDINSAKESLDKSTVPWTGYMINESEKAQLWLLVMLMEIKNPETFKNMILSLGEPDDITGILAASYVDGTGIFFAFSKGCAINATLISSPKLLEISKKYLEYLDRNKSDKPKMDRIPDREADAIPNYLNT